MKKPKGDYAIQTVINALRLLEEFRDAGEVGVTALSRRLDLHKNNVFRLLATLEERGYVEQSAETERYKLGVRALELGRAFSQGRSLLKQSRPILEALARAVGETAHLGVLRDFEVVHLDGEASDRLVLTMPRVGSRLPVHCTALGKAMLSQWDGPMRRTVYRLRGLPRQTPRTITDIDTLEAQLAQIRARGYAIDVEENEVGVNGIARWIFNGLGEVGAAISVSGHSNRLTEDVMEQIATDVMAAADSIAVAIGGGEQPDNRDSR